MRIHYFILYVFGLLLIGCSDDDTHYDPIVEPPPVSPVIVNLTEVPYPKLADYHFFDGPLKDQIPSLNVLPYEPASSLFTDYAQKKRFVWMPEGSKGTFNGDGNILELPVGAALIKSFYYDNAQNISTPGGTRLVETRIMIRKGEGWICANYIWNDEQSEALFDLTGSFTEITWTGVDNVTKSTNYRIPSEAQGIVSHE